MKDRRRGQNLPKPKRKTRKAVGQSFTGPIIPVWTRRLSQGTTWKDMVRWGRLSAFRVLRGTIYNSGTSANPRVAVSRAHLKASRVVLTYNRAAGTPEQEIKRDADDIVKLLQYAQWMESRVIRIPIAASEWPGL